jgi:hypothetical protein
MGVLMACSVRGRPKKSRLVKSKVERMLDIFLDIKGIFHKDFVLAGLTVNSTYCCDILWCNCVKMFKDFVPIWR